MSGVADLENLKIFFGIAFVAPVVGILTFFQSRMVIGFPLRFGHRRLIHPGSMFLRATQQSLKVEKDIKFSKIFQWDRIPTWPPFLQKFGTPSAPCSAREGGQLCL